MNLRCMNPDGMGQFRDYLAVLRNDPKAAVPIELLDDPRFTSTIDHSVEIGRPSLVTKLDVGRYLHDILQPISPRQLRMNVGLWAWLALWFFDELLRPTGMADGGLWKTQSTYHAREIIGSGWISTCSSFPGKCFRCIRTPSVSF